jgi:hypothetical protein
MATVREAANITPPLKNTNAMKCIAVLSVTTSSQSQDLELLFARLGAGHFMTVKADMPANSGARVYVAFGATPGTIDETSSGTHNNACWPVIDGEELHVGQVPSGREIATGIATNSYYKYLHWKGSATGYLRLYRSSFAPGQDAGEFRAP